MASRTKRYNLEDERDILEIRKLLFEHTEENTDKDTNDKQELDEQFTISYDVEDEEYDTDASEQTEIRQETLLSKAILIHLVMKMINKIFMWLKEKRTIRLLTHLLWCINFSSMNLTFLFQAVRFDDRTIREERKLTDWHPYATSFNSLLQIVRLHTHLVKM